MQNIDAFLKRFEEAQSHKSKWARVYDEALAFAAPQRRASQNGPAGSAVGSSVDGGFSQVFDSTAMVAYQKFASNLQMSLVPPFKKWVNFVPGRLVDDMDQTELRRALDKIREAFFSYIQMSNFDTQIAEALMDLGLGTGALLVQKGGPKNPLQFSAVPLSQLYLEEGPNGTVGAVFRKHTVAADMLKSTWPDAVFNEELQKIIAQTPQKPIELVEGTTSTIIEVIDPKTGLKVQKEGFLYTVVAAKEKHVLVKRQQRSNPWVVFRYSVFPGEVYGRGPLLMALPDIKTLNKTKELILKNASLSVAGAYTVADDGVININNIRIQPGALIPVASNGGGVQGPTLAPLPRSGDFNVAQILIEELRQSVNDMLFADPFGRLDLPSKTATEVALRQQALSKQLGSAFGRLQFELLAPLVDRVLHVLEEQGLIDLNNFRVDGGMIDIEHVSPLAVAQEQSELSNLLRYGETMTKLFGPQLGMFLTKPHVFARKVAQLLGVSGEVAPSEEDLATLQEVFMASAHMSTDMSAHTPADVPADGVNKKEQPIKNSDGGNLYGR